MRPYHHFTESEKEEWNTMSMTLQATSDFSVWKRCQTRRIILWEKGLGRQQTEENEV
ncbi:hypothetical protein [Aureibacillus halotolerans]|uniref:Uncharacterized protein n=1 Tax=Aureibacillus halotolerans TaxID=1508390 RepID=A0A4R6TZC1_9BACI|nr:hypothetical protein [Aureibacillus halotolerans]TDQ38706.1 hypothetical protein EV213_10975 [Aureibacillus halotolerans]